MPHWTKAAVLGVVAVLILAVIVDPGFLTGGGDADSASLPLADGTSTAPSDPPSQFASDLAEGTAAAGDAVADTTNETDALEELFARIEADPDDPTGWIELAEILVENGDFVRASEAYAAAIEADESNAEARVGLGKALLFSGMLRVARAELTRALELDPNLAEAHLNLGITYSHSAPANLDAARAAWTTVIELEPDSEASVQAQAYLDSYGASDADADASADSPSASEASSASVPADDPD